MTPVMKERPVQGPFHGGAAAILRTSRTRSRDLPSMGFLGRPCRHRQGSVGGDPQRHGIHAPGRLPGESRLRPAAIRERRGSSAAPPSAGTSRSISATMRDCGICRTTNRAPRWCASSACCATIEESRSIRLRQPRRLTRRRGIERGKARQLVVSKVGRSDGREPRVLRRRCVRRPLPPKELGALYLQGRQYPLSDDERSQRPAISGRPPGVRRRLAGWRGDRRNLGVVEPAVESAGDDIIVSCHHHMLRETTVASATSKASRDIRTAGTSWPLPRGGWRAGRRILSLFRR